jgi:hypothetical protein
MASLVPLKPSMDWQAGSMPRIVDSENLASRVAGAGIMVPGLGFSLEIIPGGKAAVFHSRCPRGYPFGIMK